MENLKQWDASPLTGQRPYEDLHNNPGGLSAICPPSLNQLDEILPARREYADTHINRPDLVAALRNSHERRGAPQSALDSIERLNEDNTFLIITGQQPGLLGGPLYTFYKVLHTIALTKRLTKERKETFVPALWNASEDHDFPEIATARWLSKDRETESFTWQGAPDTKRPYFNMPMRECPIGDLLQHLQSTTHPTEFTGPIIERIRQCARDSETYPDFFDRLIWILFEEDGLIILRPDDPWMREQAEPILKREIQKPLQNNAGLEHIAEQLQQHGLTPQIHKRADRTSFFLIEDGQRQAVYFSKEEFTTDAGGKFTTADFLGHLDENPQSFSPSAILRPVLQDAVLPTAAAVLGPSEMAYHFLLDGIYKEHAIPRPALVPRFGFTLIDGREKKLMNRYTLQPASLSGHPSALVKQIVKGDSASTWEEEKRVAETGIHQLFGRLKEHAQETDPTIIKVLEKNLARIEKDIQQSESLLIRKISAQNQQIQLHIEGLRNSLYPNDSLQERQYTIFAYLLKYGPEFLTHFKQLSGTIEEGAHHFIQIP